MKGSTVLGVDVGSVAAALVQVDAAGEIVASAYAFHRGGIRKAIRELLDGFDLAGVSRVAVTSTSPQLLRGGERHDSRVSFIAAARRLHGRVGSLLIVGGERFGLVRFEAGGGYRSLRANTSCAAGTGSFLDQQARRLGLSGSGELGRLALTSRGRAPAIASRCSVFAKTDLSHAQQEGYSLEEICDGLCLGLAHAIADTVLTGEPLPEPAVFAGGVSLNPAVARHLEALLRRRLAADGRGHLYGALGACLESLAQQPLNGVSPGFRRAEDLLEAEGGGRTYHFAPLELKLSSYPGFGAHHQYRFVARAGGRGNPVEVDLYRELPSGTVAVFLGIDIGSTSTKAMLVSADGAQPDPALAGFYTRTAGRPVEAARSLLEALADLARRRDARLHFLGVATTGAGRNFAGRVVGADLIVDEITAHARAACSLNPDTDTIIEIGGQDAKFTTLREGRVTFCQMNTVCAAGTGSFIEEQAARLGVSLEEYSGRAEGARAPLASDRCTVFMERDINQYLNRSYSVEEILAAALYSVRENYLLKVASPALIGSTVCFQGATAKNRALVAAFEEKLGRPVFVSRYCHLTGALGAALLLREAPPASSTFRGLGLYRREIPIRSEVCPLCGNHCRLRLADVEGQTVAYGFLCGRDYDTHRYVERNRSGFDLLSEHRRALRPASSGEAAAAAGGRPAGKGSAPAPVVGIPPGLHLREELALWRSFFGQLGVRVLSEDAPEALVTGKELTGAEFCAPVTAMHGQAAALARRCQALFLPLRMEADKERRDGGRRRYFCYYTQFAPTVISLLKGRGLEGRCLLPLVDHLRPGATVRELHGALRELSRLAGGWRAPGQRRVQRAYRRALAEQRAARGRLRALFESRSGAGGDIRVVLAGRPYVVLSKHMNKGIPEIFGALGVRCFYQDMLPEPAEGPEEALAPLLDAFHWNYAARILETARYCSTAPGVYPVLLTCFKCSPDSFVIEYFKRILDERGKPYLILQVDEHDSSVGYETRIEAGVRAFRNHLASQRAPEGPPASPARPARPAVPRVVEEHLDGKTLLFPNWDPLSLPLVVANLQRHGVDARLLREDDLSIRESMRLNTGQCIPINAIVQEMGDYVRRHRLDPARVMLWMARSSLSCNIPLYPYYIKSLLEAEGGGLEQAEVYLGELTHVEISPRATVGAYFAYLFGGLLRRLGCRIRPYELEAGMTDRTILECRQLLEVAFRGERSREEAIREVLRRFQAIPCRDRTAGARPKVAIFGDLYVRDNEVLNQGLIHDIEAAGGEVITTPYSEYVRIVAEAAFRRWRKERLWGVWLKHRALLAAVQLAERRYFPELAGYVPARDAFRNPRLEGELRRYHLRLQHGGESFENVLKILHLLREHPDIALFVQANPTFCCPSLITEAMTGHIEALTGVPVVTLTYDGTGTPKNDLIVPYLRCRR